MYIYIYIYTYKIRHLLSGVICVYVYVYIYTNLPVNAIVRLPHPWSGDSQGQETFLAPSTDKQTCNYARVLKPPSLPINPKYIYKFPCVSLQQVTYFSSHLLNLL